MHDDPMEILKAFVEALRLDEQGAIHLSGRRVGHLGAEQAQSVQTLAQCVYEHLYSRPFPAAPDPEAPSPVTDLTDELERANTTQSRIESDWSLLERAPDGGVIAVRHGRSRRFMAGQFMVTDGVLPASAGARLTAQLPGGSRTQQPGFFYCFSEGFLDANDLCPLVRLYYNVGTGGAADLVRIITAALNRYEIPFQLKVTTRSADFVRTDNAVLYLAEDCFQAAALAMGPVLNEIESKLAFEIPLFTKRLGHGIGFAEDPGHGESFGTSRSKLIASALVAAREGDGFPHPAFAQHFAEAVSAARLNIEALYLNPGSENSYEQPRAVSN